MLAQRLYTDFQYFSLFCAPLCCCPGFVLRWRWTSVLRVVWIWSEDENVNKGWNWWYGWHSQHCSDRKLVWVWVSRYRCDILFALFPSSGRSVARELFWILNFVGILTDRPPLYNLQCFERTYSNLSFTLYLLANEICKAHTEGMIIYSNSLTKLILGCAPIRIWNKLAKLRRKHASQVHFAKIHFE